MINAEGARRKDYQLSSVGEIDAAEQIKNKKENAYIEDLRKGKYLGILETYVSNDKWSLERVARDTWQNFFDASGGTLDDIKMKTLKENGETMITIHGDNEYDFRRLLHFGAGSKSGSITTAGKHGEGTRIYALHMLRDYGFQRVKFRSGDWELVFSLNKAPSHEVPAEMKDVRGLFAKLSFTKEKYAGNEVRLITVKEENAVVMQRAKELFFHSENKDFQHPDVATSKGGLKIQFGKKGNLYINGQRIHYDSRNKWHPLADMNVWSWETPRIDDQMIHLGRDRSLVTQKEMLDIVLPFIVNSVHSEDSQILLPILEPIYDTEVHAAPETKKLLSLLVAKLAAEKYKGDFPTNYLASDVHGFRASLLKKGGYILCNSILAEVGMKKASQEFIDIQAMHTVEMSEAEKKRSQLVQSAFERFLSESALDLNIKAKPIQVFIGEHPFLHGKYQENHVFINQFILDNGDLAKIIALYKHEISHAMGPDESAEFTYAYTDLDEAWTRYVLNNPDFLRKLQADFSALKMPASLWQSGQDFVEAVEPLLEKEAKESFAMLDPKSLDDADSKINLAKSSLRKIIENNFSGEYTPEAMISIFRTIEQNEYFKEMQDNFKNASPYLTAEQESAYNDKVKKLHTSKIRLEKLVQEEKAKISKRTKRRKVAERLMRASNISVWEEKINLYDSRIQEIRQKITKNTPYRARYLIELISKQKILDQEINLRPFLFLDQVVISALELIVKNNSSKPLDEVTGEIDEMIIFLKKNATHPRVARLTIVSALARLRQTIEDDPSEVNLIYGQRLFEEIAGTV